MNDERLISVVFEHPPIYDRNHFLFEDEGFKKYLWELIAYYDMGNTTAEECENRFQMLREKYASGILILCKNAFSEATWSQIQIMFSVDSHVLERERPMIHSCYEPTMNRYYYAPMTDRRMTDSWYAPMTDRRMTDSWYAPMTDRRMTDSWYAPRTDSSYEPMTDTSYGPMIHSCYELPSSSGAIY